VTIDPERNTIKVWNNGKGIPVQIHKVHNCYVPDMIFGQLLTSSNYDDNKKKVTGGRNGFGAKLVNIFSTEFTVETADSKNKAIYTQTWRNNMSERDEPKIVPNPEGKDYTCVTFKPDLRRFGMDKLDDDIVALMTKRVYDMAGCTPAAVRVKLNGKVIDIKNFISYVDLYLETVENKELPKIIEKPASDRWEVVCSMSDGQF
jgi:DNA topoisomerase II